MQASYDGGVPRFGYADRELANRVRRVGVTLDYAAARQRLDMAIAWAQDDGRDVPQPWTEVTRHIGQGPNKTLTAVLGTALLAKSTRTDVDPLSLKENFSDTAYSARTLCHNVLVPASQNSQHPFDLGARGREPLNNQPFFRYDHLTLIDRSKSLDMLAYLNEQLTTLTAATTDEALAALAAFLRERMKTERARRAATSPQVASGPIDLPALTAAISAFLDIHEADRPARLQAVVGGLVAVSVESVSTQGLYDPSRHAPGDVHVPDEFEPRWAAEVRGKPVGHYEAQQFIEKCGAMNIRSAWLVVLHPSHEPLDASALHESAEIFGTTVYIVECVEDLVAVTIGHPAVLDEQVAAVPQRVTDQLVAIRAENGSVERWAELMRATAFRDSDATTPEPHQPSSKRGDELPFATRHDLGRRPEE